MDNPSRYVTLLTNVWSAVVTDIVKENGVELNVAQVRRLVTDQVDLLHPDEEWGSLDEASRQQALEAAFPADFDYRILRIETVHVESDDWVLKISFNDPLPADDASSVETIEYWSTDQQWDPLLVRAKQFDADFDAAESAIDNEALMRDQFFVVHRNRAIDDLAISVEKADVSAKARE